jgi:two-component system NtrC family sensor kinase
VVQNVDLLEILDQDNISTPYRGEIPLEDGRVFSAQVTPIPEVGLALIMQDITYLKELDRIKSDFVSTVSHDLRSPLTAILGYVELLGRVGDLSAQQQEFIVRIQASVENITSLINDLLDLGRIEAGFDARKEIVPLSALLRYTVESMYAQAEDVGLSLEMEIPDGLPPVIGNPVRLRQMLENLIANSLAYTPNGGKIWINARSEGDQVLLEVSDNGPGIPPADQPYIFDKFYRASNVPYQVSGAGLGLAIVKSIVENHRGRIWVDSSLGEGARFSIILPVSDQEL